MSHNIYELFRNRFAEAYNEPFLCVPGDRTYTYADIDQRSAAMAAVLVAEGVQVGDRAIVQVDKSADAIALYWACLRAGIIYTPLNTGYTAEECGFFIGDAEPTAFIFSPSRAGKLQPVGDLSGVPVMHTLGAAGDGSLAEAASASPGLSRVVRCAPDDSACILYTSGTTGRSKGAMLTHANLASNARALHAIWRFRPGDVLLHTLPIFHVHGLFVALHTAILNASEVILLPKFDAEAVRAYLSSATVMMGVPTQYSRLLSDADFGVADCETIRMFTSGSAPLPQSVFREFSLRTGHQITERYGMTECGIITSNPPEGQRQAGTVGYALPDVEVRIVNKSGRPVGAGEIGMLEVRGPNVFAGYWQAPEKTAKEMTRDGFFRTGDIGSMATDGRISLVGRVSDMIISGGYNVYPKEVELLLEQVPGVVETAVVGLPHPDFGEGVVAFVVAEPGVTDAELHDGIAHRLAKFKLPKSYMFVDDLPRNAMGKVQKSQLRTDYRDTFAPLSR